MSTHKQKMEFSPTGFLSMVVVFLTLGFILGGGVWDLRFNRGTTYMDGDDFFYVYPEGGLLSSYTGVYGEYIVKYTNARKIHKIRLLEKPGKEICIEEWHDILREIF